MFLPFVPHLLLFDGRKLLEFFRGAGIAELSLQMEEHNTAGKVIALHLADLGSPTLTSLMVLELHHEWSWNRARSKPHVPPGMVLKIRGQN